MTTSLSAISTEKNFNLDYSIEQRRPHWSIVNDMLGLYRSAIIYSNGQYKIITDRGDLPVRQVFHSGNMIKDRTEIKIGGDPFRPNQMNIQYSNQSIDYENDVIYIQDSASLFGRNEPLKIMDAALQGISRRTEVYRQGSIQLRRKTEIKRQVTWATGLEGIAVEPGDVAAVGISMTDFEMGYGGRAVDGSSLQLISDREVTINSGFLYDLYVWHSATDSLETRVLANPAGTHIGLTPTSGFFECVIPGDRFATGINSEDLLKVRVLKISRDEFGITEMVGEEYKPVTFDIICVDSKPPPAYSPSPSQPSTASFVISNCNLCVQVVTVPGCVGGMVPGNSGSNSKGAVFLSTSLNPMPQSLVSDTVTFISGPQAGRSFVIRSWGGSAGYAFNQGGLGNPGSFQAIVSPLFLDGSPQSGDQYYISYRTPTFGGMRVEIYKDNQWQQQGIIFGNSGCVSMLNTFDITPTRLIPFSDAFADNVNGPWTSSMLPTPGCSNLNFNNTSLFVTGESLQPFYAISFPGSTLLTANKFELQANGLLTEACSPQGESTDVTFSLVYGSQTVIGGMTVPLNTATSQTTLGSLNPFQINFSLTAANTTGKQTAQMRYEGPSVDTVYYNLFNTGIATVDSTKPQTLGIFALFTHGHSHACYSLKFTNALGDLTDVSSNGTDI